MYGKKCAGGITAKKEKKTNPDQPAPAKSKSIHVMTNETSSNAEVEGGGNQRLKAPAETRCSMNAQRIMEGESSRLDI